MYVPYCCLLLSWKSWNWFECVVGGVLFRFVSMCLSQQPHEKNRSTPHPQHTQISSNYSTIATDNSTDTYLIHYSTEFIAFFSEYTLFNNFNFNLAYRYPFSVNLTLSITVKRLPDAVVTLVVITNKMQLSYGIHYSTYVSSSTCFERYVAHHQEPQLYLSLWFKNACGVRPWCCLSGNSLPLRQHQVRTPQAFVNQRLKYSWGSWWWTTWHSKHVELLKYVE
jgi:hypothetical protein